MLATIGEAVGSVAAVGVVVFFVWFYRKEMRKRREFEKRKGSLHQFLLNSSSEW
ncbi:hypothetical protein BCR33DRAFT_714414 [Rhizoclosmatium globosum]|uniref:Uncharacterized protein n=1 Tax=Rhizoclosmatium globosum TaxID=329046 RepID=A0A1Y2CPB7_9FUNG|nr:hypothetical protein BCR33DRAFT_714414 [Rhizoclosmatium globosum]|eukprot:ORY48684.1 hypothetical protein BCR33DRAFT_714414 [Rhizoclosmatium globosum]